MSYVPPYEPSNRSEDRYGTLHVYRFRILTPSNNNVYNAPNGTNKLV